MSVFVGDNRVGLLFEKLLPRMPKVYRGMIVAAVCGALSPYLLLPINHLCPFKDMAGAHFAFITLMLLNLLLALVIHREFGVSNSLRNGAVLRKTIVCLMLFMTGVVCSTFCFHNHVCMEGHMAHPPYQSAEYWEDAAWVAALWTAAAVSAWARSPVYLGLTFFASALSVFRFLHGSWGGVFLVPV